MSAVIEELEKDAKYLRGLAQYRRDAEEPKDAEQLDRIAGYLDSIGVMMFTPGRLLEAKAEKAAAEWVDTCLDTEFEQHEEIQLFLWLIQLRLKEAGTKSLMGGGLAGLGLGVASSLFRGGGGEKKAPIDPEDK